MWLNNRTISDSNTSRKCDRSEVVECSSFLSSHRYLIVPFGENKIIKRALESMNIEKTINIISIIGVTRSLLFVGAELRLTNKIAQVETEW